MKRPRKDVEQFARCNEELERLMLD